jgi:hypothetical protein
MEQYQLIEKKPNAQYEDLSLVNRLTIKRIKRDLVKHDDKYKSLRDKFLTTDKIVSNYSEVPIVSYRKTDLFTSGVGLRSRRGS